jgi:hypothetical protein
MCWRRRPGARQSGLVPQPRALLSDSRVRESCERSDSFAAALATWRSMLLDGVVAIDDLRPLEIIFVTVGKAANGVDDVIEIEHSDGTARRTKSEGRARLRSCLARGDRTDNYDEVRHHITLAAQPAKSYDPRTHTGGRVLQRGCCGLTQPRPFTCQVSRRGMPGNSPRCW